MATTGKIVQVIGSTMDAQFPATELPAIYNALQVEMERNVQRSTLWCEVQQHLGGNKVRAVALGSTDGLRRGMPIVDMGRRPAAGQKGWLEPRASTPRLRSGSA